MRRFGQAVFEQADVERLLRLDRAQRLGGQPAQGAELADRLLDLIALHDASNIAAVSLPVAVFWFEG